MKPDQKDTTADKRAESAAETLAAFIQAAGPTRSFPGKRRASKTRRP